ncbi:hypothetical protein VTL71DRAFT_6503 [Oculimacula yallundae]|uniref:Clathrin light chain n=1 Tax=Oculimacula yallundae TaxID=86028 RepID=A0ABR4BY31_9HELO
MDLLTDFGAPGLPALLTSNTTMPTTTSEATPKDSPKLEPVEFSAAQHNKSLEESPKTKAKAESETENNALAPAVDPVLARPTLPHANTDTVFEKAKGAQRVERRWRGMYDRNRAANPGATRGL